MIVANVKPISLRVRQQFNEEFVKPVQQEQQQKDSEFTEQVEALTKESSRLFAQNAELERKLNPEPEPDSDAYAAQVRNAGIQFLKEQPDYFATPRNFA